MSLYDSLLSFCLASITPNGCSTKSKLSVASNPICKGGGMGFKTCTREEGESSKKREREREQHRLRYKRLGHAGRTLFENQTAAASRATYSSDTWRARDHGRICRRPTQSSSASRTVVRSSGKAPILSSHWAHPKLLSSSCAKKTKKTKKKLRKKHL